MRTKFPVFSRFSRSKRTTSKRTSYFLTTAYGEITGDGGLTTIDSTGGGTLTLYAANTFSGATTVDGSSETQLVLGNPLALQDSTFDTSGPGILNFDGCSDVAFAGLQGSGNLSLPSTVALTVGGNGLTTTLSGNLLGSGSLTEEGPGELILSGGNGDFTGETTVVWESSRPQRPHHCPSVSSLTA